MHIRIIKEKGKKKKENQAQKAEDSEVRYKMQKHDPGRAQSSLEKELKLCLGPEIISPERQLWRRVDEKHGVVPFGRSLVNENRSSGNLGSCKKKIFKTQNSDKLFPIVPSLPYTNVCLIKQP
jgi:hypothetical protein